MATQTPHLSECACDEATTLMSLLGAAEHRALTAEMNLREMTLRADRFLQKWEA